VPRQAGIARRERPVDLRHQPAVDGALIGTFRARAQQQDEKDSSSSHEDLGLNGRREGEGQIQPRPIDTTPFYLRQPTSYPELLQPGAPNESCGRLDALEHMLKCALK